MKPSQNSDSEKCREEGNGCRVAEFGSGEWDALLEEGDASGPVLDGIAVLAELRALRHGGQSDAT